MKQLFLSSILESYYKDSWPRLRSLNLFIIYIALICVLICLLTLNTKLSEYNLLVMKDIENSNKIVNIFNPEIKRAQSK